MRPQPLAVRPQQFDQAGAGVQQRQVVVDDLRDTGTQYLDRDFRAVVQPREMHLRNRGAGDCGRIEFCKYLVDGLAIGALERGQHKLRRERRHLVLQFGEFVGDIRRQQIAPRRQHLTEFDEDRTERLQRKAQPHCAWRVKLAPEQQRLEHGTQAAHTFVAEKELVEAEVHADADNFRQSKQTHNSILTANGVIGHRMPRPQKFLQRRP